MKAVKKPSWSEVLFEVSHKRECESRDSLQNANPPKPPQINILMIQSSWGVGQDNEKWYETKVAKRTEIDGIGIGPSQSIHLALKLSSTRKEARSGAVRYAINAAQVPNGENQRQKRCVNGCRSTSNKSDINHFCWYIWCCVWNQLLKA